MSTTPTGLLLPQEVLYSWWFMLLATVVAFNTVIYVGLTLAKVIPWPRQFHPAQVRSSLNRVGVKIQEDAAMSELPVPEVPESDDPYQAMRLRVARQQMPQAFALMGGLVILIALASTILRIHEFLVFELATGVVFMITSVVLAHRPVRGRTMIWLWTAAATWLVCLLCADAIVSNSQLPIGYTLLMLTSFMPIALGWRPALIGAALMLSIIVIANLCVDATDDVRLIIFGASALLVGAVLLQIRISAVNALVDQERRADAVASTDPLTGVLTRHGIQTLIPGFAANAERTGQPVCVIYVDVNNLGLANKQYGNLYGDDVLRTVAEAVGDHLRRGDLLARWDSDEFLAVGVGRRPDPEQLAERLNDGIRLTGVALGKWPVTVRVGTTSANPEETTFERMLDEAQRQVTHAPATGDHPSAEPSSP